MNERKSFSTAFWSLVGKLAALAGLIWIVIQIIGFFGQGDYDVVAQDEHFKLSFPSFFSQELKKLSDSNDWDSISVLLPASISGSHRSETVGRIHEYMRRNFPSQLESDLRLLGSMWQFTITNEGGREVKDLNLELPFEGIFSLQKAGDTAKTGRFKKVVPLGALRPSNTIVVTVWAQEFNNRVYEDQTRLTHPSGVIKIDYPETVFGFLAWYKRTIGLSTLTLITFLSVVSLFVLVVFKIWSDISTFRRSKKQEGT
jgi:hypothetical protein